MRRTTSTGTPPSGTRPTTLLGVVLASVVLVAACGSDPEPAAQETTPAASASEATTASTATDAATETGTSSASETATSSEPAAGGVVVEIASSDLGDVLVDAEGRTLYVFDNDDVDTSACTGECLAAWPPLVGDAPTAGDGVTAELGTFTRDDGDVQVTANGLPLYYYGADTAPGETNGQGVGDVWWVVDSAGEKITEMAPAASAEAGYGDPNY